MPFGFFSKRETGAEKPGLSAGVAFYETGLRCQRRCDYVGASRNYANAERVFRQHGDKDKLIMCLNNVGSVGLYLEQYETAIAALNEAERLCRETANVEELAKVRNNQGAVHL